MKKYKKPTTKRFREALEATGGNLTETAKVLGVKRGTIWLWAKDDEEFAEAIEETRKQFLDSCIATSRLVALGKPIVNDKGEFEGWQVPPDSNMLRYLMGTLGRDEGFGEAITLKHTAEEGVDISRWIEKEIEEKQKASREEQ
jgi:predicted DNA-binding transcriptional regulator AlpA